MKLKMNLLVALVVGLMSAPMTANADVTQLIHFDDANNGWKWYSDKDNNFLFNPTNLQSSVLCADSTNGGNGSCLIEGTQGVLPLMTRPLTGPYIEQGQNQVESQGSASKDPIFSGAQPFDLDSFYFLLTGNGTGSENAITVAGGTGTVGTNPVHTFTFYLGSNWDAGDAPDVTIYEGVGVGLPAGDLVKQKGYIATFGDLFDDVTWIQFSAPSTAQVRLDCVVATFDGTTTQPASGFTTGCGSRGTGGDPPLPEPATLALLGLGLAGLAFSRRK